VQCVTSRALDWGIVNGYLSPIIQPDFPIQSFSYDRGPQSERLPPGISFLSLAGEGIGRTVEGIHHLAGPPRAGPLRRQPIPPAAVLHQGEPSKASRGSARPMARASSAAQRKNVFCWQMSQFAALRTWAAQRLRSIPGWDQSGPGRIASDPSQDPGRAESIPSRVVRGSRALAGCVRPSPFRSEPRPTSAPESKATPLLAFTLSRRPKAFLHPSARRSRFLVTAILRFHPRANPPLRSGLKVLDQDSRVLRTSQRPVLRCRFRIGQLIPEQFG